MSAPQVDGPVADLDDVAGPHRQRAGHVEVAVEDVAEQPGGVGGVPGALPQQISIDIPVEGQRVDTVGGPFVSRDQLVSRDRGIEIRMVHLVQVDPGKSRRTVRDRIVGELQNGGVAQADSERAGPVNPVVGHGHDLGPEPGGSKTILAGRSDDRPVDRQAGAGAGVAEIDRDALTAQVGERALGDR